MARQNWCWANVVVLCNVRVNEHPQNKGFPTADFDDYHIPCGDLHCIIVAQANVPHTYVLYACYQIL